MDTGTYVCFSVDYSAEVSVYLRVEQGMGHFYVTDPNFCLD